MSNSSNYTKDVVVFFDGLYKVNKEIENKNKIYIECLAVSILLVEGKKLVLRSRYKIE